MSAITTHVLDISRGQPAAGVPVSLEAETSDGWKLVGAGTTDENGRISDLVSAEVSAGVHRLIFDTAKYFAAHNVRGFYPQVVVVFTIRDPGQHHHVPLLLSPFGYSTYRGS